MLTAVLTDDEIAAICAGLRQPAAMIRYLRRLGLRVERKPNGRPLVRRAELRCVQALGGSRLDEKCAAAARRVGVWIGQR